MPTITTERIDVKHSEYYKGFMWQLWNTANSLNRAEVMLSPDHQNTLLEMLGDYTEQQARIKALEVALKPFADLVRDEAARKAPRNMRISPKMELKQFLMAHSTLYRDMV